MSSLSLIVAAFAVMAAPVLLWLLTSLYLIEKVGRPNGAIFVLTGIAPALFAAGTGSLLLRSPHLFAAAQTAIFLAAAALVVAQVTVCVVVTRMDRATA